jgi:hypothetical protein
MVTDDDLHTLQLVTVLGLRAVRVGSPSRPSPPLYSDGEDFPHLASEAVSCSLGGAR